MLFFWLHIYSQKCIIYIVMKKGSVLPMKAYLILDNGQVFEGEQFGSDREAICEIVFNTSMTGYTELLTDPSYSGQGVVMTYPLIGNYGVCHEDFESRRPSISALIVRELSRTPSNFRSEMTLHDYLLENDVIGLQGVDTRALTKILREQGTMKGLVTTSLAHRYRLKYGREVNWVYEVSCKEKRVYEGPGKRVALMDFGAKENIIRSLSRRGCQVTVYPCAATAEEILGDRPDGIMLSNGPGDPKQCGDIIPQVRRLYESGCPVFAICLGHQLMALATGADTFKLKYGHRGANHPVKDLRTGRCFMTSQNHGYAVEAASVDPAIADVSFRNLNDGTVEGISYRNQTVRTVQFHPEASPGPQDTAYLFDEFMEMMEGDTVCR